MAILKSRNMFFENKSSSGLSEKSDVQHRVVCDWLRNLDKKMSRIERSVENLHKGFDILLKDEGSPDVIEGQENDDSSAYRPIL